MKMANSFACESRCSCGAPVSWEASWQALDYGDSAEQMRVSDGTASHDLIIGEAPYDGMQYLCIPSLNVGIEVESLTDSRRIESRLVNSCGLDTRTAVTIARGLYECYKPRER